MGDPLIKTAQGDNMPIPATYANSPYIWQDGKLVDFKDATIHVLSYSLHYANAVFEGIRAYKSPKGMLVFRLRDHLQRLLDSAKTLMLEIPYNLEQLEQATLELLRANQCSEDTYIRPLIFMGLGALSVCNPTPPIHTIIGSMQWRANEIHGIKVKTSSFSKPSVQASPNRAKASAHYLNSHLAKQEALLCGCEEALLLDTQGFVAEGSAESLFIVSKGTLIAPPLDSTLDSITRQTILELAQHLQIPTLQRRLVREEIYTAQEAFFVGTGAEITPIKSLDFREIGNPDNAPITQALSQTYMQLVRGQLNHFNHYLTPLN